MARRKKIADVQVEEPKAYIKEKDHKELAVEKLSTLGFNVVLESGVVMAKLKTIDDINIFKKAVEDVGYNSSYGVRIIREENNYEVG